MAPHDHDHDQLPDLHDAVRQIHQDDQPAAQPEPPDPAQLQQITVALGSPAGVAAAIRAAERASESNHPNA